MNWPFGSGTAKSGPSVKPEPLTFFLPSPITDTDMPDALVVSFRMSMTLFDAVVAVGVRLYPAPITIVA